eukprot:TRINITY_DN4174_c0_g1_i2.p1 TRINITY_DN4174_c0_g1~~TRINITY_DN4174_c0_g1_i2.p1  ORF type:complete len:241 (-),score=36.45 TRINITY_DN4174_c0_g1_i2:83-805(-)
MLRSLVGSEMCIRDRANIDSPDSYIPKDRYGTISLKRHQDEGSITGIEFDNHSAKTSEKHLSTTITVTTTTPTITTTSTTTTSPITASTTTDHTITADVTPDRDIASISSKLATISPSSNHLDTTLLSTSLKDVSSAHSHSFKKALVVSDRAVPNSFNGRDLNIKQQGPRRPSSLIGGYRSKGNNTTSNLESIENLKHSLSDDAIISLRNGSELKEAIKQGILQPPVDDLEITTFDNEKN